MSDYDVGGGGVPQLYVESKLRPYTRVDFTCLLPAYISDETPFIKCWRERILIGISLSPPLPRY